MAFAIGDKIVAARQIGDVAYRIEEGVKGVVKYVYKRTNGTLAAAFPYDVVFDTMPGETYPVTINEIKAAE